jgi:hypothetical protein
VQFNNPDPVRRLKRYESRKDSGKCQIPTAITIEMIKMKKDLGRRRIFVSERQ